MANEFQHKTVGSDLTQAEWEDVTGHQFESQATGDILYASSATQLSRLGIGSEGQALKVAGGVPAWADVAVVKTTDETIQSSTTLQNDDELQITGLVVGDVVDLLLALVVDSTATADFKFALSMPSSSDISYHLARLTTSGSVAETTAMATQAAIAINAGGVDRPAPIVFLRAVIYIGTSGSLVLQWAQNSSEASDTTVKAGSIIQYSVN